MGTSMAANYANLPTVMFKTSLLNETDKKTLKNP